jgi:hypothetical protein
VETDRAVLALDSAHRGWVTFCYLIALRLEMPTDKVANPAAPRFNLGQGWEDVPGKLYFAYTNNQRWSFKCWVPDDGVPENDRFFCHGHTFDTYRRFGYSPFSGKEVRLIIEDEYQAVPKAEAGHFDIQAGDVVTWSKATNIIHSCLVINVAGIPTVNTVTMWSKNGRQPITVMKLYQVNRIYPSEVVEYWRVKPPEPALQV